jgi:hypothetical protein
MSNPGLPDPQRVVAEKTASSPVVLAQAFGAAPAAPATFRILVTNELDEYDQEPQLAALDAGFALEGFSDEYTGTDRKAAKLAISSAQAEEFADLKDLIASLTPDKTMIGLHLSTKADSGRVKQEERNVRLKVFLYAASREGDNDFHLMLGRDPEVVGDGSVEEPMYMTMELSGLPPESFPSFERLQTARQAFKDYFGVNLPGTGYQFYDPPRPVEIEGSLFFDTTHAKGSHPGPKKLRDFIPTIWEVHPISSMEFLE